LRCMSPVMTCEGCEYAFRTGRGHRDVISLVSDDVVFRFFECPVCSAVTMLDYYKPVMRTARAS
jgi:hypothetical protein